MYIREFFFPILHALQFIRSECLKNLALFIQICFSLLSVQLTLDEKQKSAMDIDEPKMEALVLSGSQVVPTASSEAFEVQGQPPSQVKLLNSSLFCTTLVY